MNKSKDRQIEDLQHRIAKLETDRKNDALDGQAALEERDKSIAELEAENKNLLEIETDLNNTISVMQRGIYDWKERTEKAESQLAAEQRKIESAIEALESENASGRNLDIAALHILREDLTLPGEKQEVRQDYKEWYESIMQTEYVAKGYYKCNHCGGPVSNGLCCAWCGSDCPGENSEHKAEKVDMTKYVEVDGWGNCVSACLCTILGMNITDIPEETQKAIRYQPSLEKYLGELGYSVKTTKDLSAIPEDVEFLLVTGTSNRNYDTGKPIQHLVVYDRNGSMFHDPHKSRYGIDEILEYQYLIPNHITHAGKMDSGAENEERGTK